jgi:hypothetical protein
MVWEEAERGVAGMEKQQLTKGNRVWVAHRSGGC